MSRLVERGSKPRPIVTGAAAPKRPRSQGELMGRAAKEDGTRRSVAAGAQGESESHASRPPPRRLLDRRHPAVRWNTDSGSNSSTDLGTRSERAASIEVESGWSDRRCGAILNYYPNEINSLQDFAPIGGGCRRHRARRMLDSARREASPIDSAPSHDPRERRRSGRSRSTIPAIRFADDSSLGQPLDRPDVTVGDFIMIRGARHARA